MIQYNDIIKSISTSQHEILNNIQIMHNDGKPFECDITYSQGNFYGDFLITKDDGSKKNIRIDEPKFKFDVFPQFDDVVKIEPYGKIPLENESVESIVIDLPFVVFPQMAPSTKIDNGEKKNVAFKRFSSYYPAKEMFKSYSHWINEAFRILKEGGICVFKCQNTISGGVFYCTEEYSWMEAQKAGFYVLDRFTLIAKSRIISGKIKTQQHARNFTSTFWVFKKGGKIKSVDYYKFLK